MHTEKAEYSDTKRARFKKERKKENSDCLNYIEYFVLAIGYCECLGTGQDSIS